MYTAWQGEGGGTAGKYEIHSIKMGQSKPTRNALYTKVQYGWLAYSWLASCNNGLSVCTVHVELHFILCDHRNDIQSVRRVKDIMGNQIVRCRKLC